MEKKVYDVAVVGGGPAGLSAALTARVRNKSVVIFEHMGLHTICPTNHAGDRIVRMLSGEKMNKKIEFGLHTVDFDVRPAERHQIGKNVGELRGNPGEVVFGIIRKSGAFVLAGLAPLKPEAGDEIVYSRAID